MNMEAVVEQLSYMHLTVRADGHEPPPTRAFIRPTTLPLEIRRRGNEDGCGEYGVFAVTAIPGGAYLGDIQGDRKYVWDVMVNEFVLFVDDECVIDMTSEPRDIMAYVREDFYHGIDPNCELVTFGSRDGYLHVGFRTLHDIQAGEELVHHRSQDLFIDAEFDEWSTCE